ncbi:MAG: tRNA uridine-5-carboxymethylaminomethyl(34) synthesis GTPase MnmE [bacterium]
MDTIAAISTAVGQSAIGIIKISGPVSVETAQRLFLSKGQKDLMNVPSHTIHYGYIVDPSSGVKIDEVLISLMRSPHSYTREDVVEINCHGGKIPLLKILELVLQEGVRMAEPGEFTKRAFLNGRINLTQAEAVIDLIHVQSEQGLNVFLETLEGNAFKPVFSLHNEMVTRLTHLEAELNFPEDLHVEISQEEFLQDIDRWLVQISAFLSTYRERSLFLNGLRLVISGRTNVGKSSIMNRVLQKERSIVTPIPGTTTDIIEDSFYLHGILIRLIDSAGFRKSQNEIEEEGLRRSHCSIHQADLNMMVFDISQPIDQDDQYVINLVQGAGKPCFAVLNKIDLGIYEQHDLISQLDDRKIPYLQVSALTGQGLSGLPDFISRLGLPDYKDSLHMAINLRQKSLLVHIKESLQDLKSLIISQQPVELFSEELKNICNQFARLKGDQFSEDILDRIFSSFCIGK